MRDHCSSVVSLVAGGLDVGVRIDDATVVSAGAGERVTLGLKRGLRDQERRELRLDQCLVGSKGAGFVVAKSGLTYTKAASNAVPAVDTASVKGSILELRIRL